MHFYPTSIPHLHNAKCIKCLGYGGFGCIKLYMCKEKENGCQCKKLFVIKQCKLKHTYAKKKTLKEYTIGTILDHPCIRKPIDIDITNKCLIYEYFPSEDLYTILHKNQQTTQTQKLTFFSQLLDAVEYMHHIGIAHMDIKLENVLVDTYSQQIKLIDFGEAFVFHDTTHILNNIPCKGIRGTIEYMPPEEFTDDFYNPEKADVWACGITLYCLLNYTYPWEQASTKYKKFTRYIIDKNYMLHTNIDIHNILKMFLETTPTKRDSIKNIKQHFDSLQVSTNHFTK